MCKRKPTKYPREFQTPIKGMTFMLLEGKHTFFFDKALFDKKPTKKAASLTGYWMVRVI